VCAFELILCDCFWAGEGGERRGRPLEAEV
jgi:hypothetical protein